jgi:hypothetical protein
MTRRLLPAVLVLCLAAMPAIASAPRNAPNGAAPERQVTTRQETALPGALDPKIVLSRAVALVLSSVTNTVVSPEVVGTMIVMALSPDATGEGLPELGTALDGGQIGPDGGTNGPDPIPSMKGPPPTAY